MTEPRKPGPRARLTVAQWDTVRSYWSTTGASLRDTAKHFGLPYTSVHKHWQLDGWKRDPSNPIEEKTVRKVAQREAQRVIRDQDHGQNDHKNGDHSPVITIVPQTPDEINEAEAEIRAAKVMEHRQEWRDFESRIRSEALRVFESPPMLVKYVRGPDGELVPISVPDFSKIEAAKRIAETLAIKQKAERAAYNLDHNLNLSKKAEEAERMSAIKDTFKALREMVEEVAEREKAIDITPVEQQ